jgi:hypothetical protein
MDEPTREEIGDLLRRLVDTVVEMKDRAEAAQARIEELEAKLAKALGAMAINPWSIGHSEWKRHVNDTMAELKGEKNE